MFEELLEALKQRPAFVRLMRIVEVLIIDALIAIVNMVLIAIVGGLAHVLHLDTHQLFQGLTVADIFKAAHA